MQVYVSPSESYTKATNITISRPIFLAVGIPSGTQRARKRENMVSHSPMFTVVF